MGRVEDPNLLSFSSSLFPHCHADQRARLNNCRLSLSLSLYSFCADNNEREISYYKRGGGSIVFVCTRGREIDVVVVVRCIVCRDTSSGNVSITRTRMDDGRSRRTHTHAHTVVFDSQIICHLLLLLLLLQGREKGKIRFNKYSKPSCFAPPPPFFFSFPFFFFFPPFVDEVA